MAYFLHEKSTLFQIKITCIIGETCPKTIRILTNEKKITKSQSSDRREHYLILNSRILKSSILNLGQFSIDEIKKNIYKKTFYLQIIYNSGKFLKMVL